MKRSRTLIDAAHETLDSNRVLEAKCRKAVADLKRQCPDAFPTMPLAASEVAPPVTVNSTQASSLFSIAFAAAVGADPEASGKVVWVDGDSELLVRTDKVRVVFRDGFALVGIPVFTEQSGEAEIVVSFAAGRASEPIGMVTATETTPRGPAVIVERWGEHLVAAAWTALIKVSTGIASAAGVDDQHQPLIPAALVLHEEGITVTPQALHPIDRIS